MESLKRENEELKKEVERLKEKIRQYVALLVSQKKMIDVKD